MTNKIVAACLLLAGCIPGGNGPGTGAEASGDAKTNAPVSYLCVGMEESKRFGSCPGCRLDATRMDALLREKFGYSGSLLISEKATKSAVVEKLKAGIESTPAHGLFLFCYSGHGGQEYIGGKEPDGADRQDEYLCLYDTYMLDDEIWEIVSKCKGRVFLYFDACHSATMYRSIQIDIPVFEHRSGGGSGKVAKAMSVESRDKMVSSKGFTFHPERFVGAQAMWSDGKPQFRMLCWSGCKESQYSYGGNAGGVMTSALIRNWEKGMSYSLLWGRTRLCVTKEQPTQNPVQTVVGDWPTLSEAFR